MFNNRNNGVYVFEFCLDLTVVVLTKRKNTNSDKLFVHTNLIIEF